MSKATKNQVTLFIGMPIKHSKKGYINAEYMVETSKPSYFCTIYQ